MSHTCVRYRCGLIVLAVLPMLLLPIVQGAGFEGFRAAQLDGVLNIPFGNWRPTSLQAGPGGELSVLYALHKGRVVQVSAGVLAPQSSDSRFMLFEVPVSASLLFLAASENASTPYAGFGPAWSLVHSKFKYSVMQGAQVVEKTTTEDRGRIGYSISTGYLYAPEYFQSTYFHLRLRYTQFLINNAVDLRNLDMLIGMGYRF